MGIFIIGKNQQAVQGIPIGRLKKLEDTVNGLSPGSTGFTQVFGEVIGSVGSATFTLAHTPITGTVRVYRGGAYQQVGIGNDYTISGANGTLSSVLQQGEILLADYHY